MRHRTKADERTKRVTGYVRVSTERQANEGVSLDAQRDRIEAWCKATDHRLAGIHTDAGLSGGRADNRPGLQAALEDVCREGGVLAVYSLSRLARSTRDAILIAERLEKAGADLVSLTESIDTTSATGRLFFRLMAVLAEFERDQLSERVKMAMGYKRTRGERVSRYLPFGFRLGADGVRLEPDEGERAVLSRICQLRGSGLSQRAIVQRLNTEGAPCRGARWHLRGVQLALAAAVAA